MHSDALGVRVLGEVVLAAAVDERQHAAVVPEPAKQAPVCVVRGDLAGDLVTRLQELRLDALQ